MNYTKEQLDFIRAVNSGGGVSSQGESSEGKQPYKMKKKQGEDLTVDGYIGKYGGIHSAADDKMHTTKYSYMESLKAKNLTIKDW